MHRYRNGKVPLSQPKICNIPFPNLWPHHNKITHFYENWSLGRIIAVMRITRASFISLPKIIFSIKIIVSYVYCKIDSPSSIRCKTTPLNWSSSLVKLIKTYNIYTTVLKRSVTRGLLSHLCFGLEIVNHIIIDFEFNTTFCYYLLYSRTPNWLETFHP